MSATLLEMPRAKKDETENTRISRSIMRKVRVISGYLGMSAPDYLNERLAPIVDKEHSDLIAKLAKEEARRKSQ